MVVSDVRVWALFNLIITSDTSKFEIIPLSTLLLSVYFSFFQATPINIIARVTRTWSFTEIPQISGVLDQNLTKIWWLCWLFSGFFAGWFFSLLFQECSVLCKPGECCCILLWPNSDSQLPEQCCQYQLDIWLATQTGLKLKEFTKFNQIHE